MAVYDWGKREMTCPYNCGKAFGEVSDEELKAMTVNLTPEQSRSGFAKYYFRPLELPDEDQTAAIMGPPLLPEECIMPENAGRLLLKADGRQNHNAYGVLPNGVGYASILIRQTGINDEMIRKYREEFAHDPYLFYKVWFPGSHLLHYTNGAVEDFGYGMLNIGFSLDEFSLEHIGLTEDEIKKEDPGCLNILASTVEAHYLYEPGRTEYITMLQYTREVENGRELYIKFWLGLKLEYDGKYTIKDQPDKEYTEFVARCTMNHCIKEYMNQLGHIKAFWEETK